MMTEEEMKEYEKEEFREKLVSLAKGFVVGLIRVFVVLVILCTMFTLLITLIGRMELDPIADIDNILWWFVKVPLAICIPYYFFLSYICHGVKHLGMQKDERELQWNLFRYLIVTPIILILILKTASMMISPTAFPIWMHYGPVWDGITLEHYQPIWAEHVNACYASSQRFLEDVSYLTGIKWLNFLPTLESIL